MKLPRFKKVHWGAWIQDSSNDNRVSISDFLLALRESVLNFACFVNSYFPMGSIFVSILFKHSEKGECIRRFKKTYKNNSNNKQNIQQYKILHNFNKIKIPGKEEEVPKYYQFQRGNTF